MPKNLQDFIQFSNSNNFTSEFQKRNWLPQLSKFQTRKLKELIHAARDKGHYTANRMVKQVDKVFHPQKLNPNDAKVIFYPVVYVVFNGMKDHTTEGVEKHPAA